MPCVALQPITSQLMSRVSSSRAEWAEHKSPSPKTTRTRVEGMRTIFNGAHVLVPSLSELLVSGPIAVRLIISGCGRAVQWSVASELIGLKSAERTLVLAPAHVALSRRDLHTITE